MGEKRFTVIVGGKPYSAEFQTAEKYAVHWQRVLERAYGTAAACDCPGRSDRRLAIRKAGTGYILARYPETGEAHHFECKYYGARRDWSGLQCYDVKAVEDAGDGNLRVRLARGIIIGQNDAPVAPDRVHEPRGSRVRQPAVTLLGLLHLLWSKARLNFWHPQMEGKRNPRRISYWMHEAAASITASKHRLNKVLLVSADKGSTWHDSNKAVTAHAADRGLRTLVVAPLMRFQSTLLSAEPTTLPLSGPFGMPTLTIAAGVWERTAQRFGRQLSAWRGGARVIAIGHFTPYPGRRAAGEIVDIGLMQVSEQWIPVESSYEQTVESRLREQRRHFEKPLRFDADNESFFPDFWLLDTATRTPLEVFGMSTQEYLQRRKAKSTWLDHEFGANGWWSWDAAADPTGESITSFPPPAQITVHQENVAR